MYCVATATCMLARGRTPLNPQRKIKENALITKPITKRLRLSEKEWEIIQFEMQKSHLNFSQFALTSMLKSQPKIPAKKARVLANKDLIIELAKWGNNLNQIAKHLNTQKSMDKISLKMLAEIEKNLEQIKAHFVS
ncbi:plasmid mobilization protein [Helicobacter suis]|uniref:plasmid mobilization protein n=1 Tax=Helicobacter suis TaxID=104628 RepID=UPI000CF0FBD1|nr:plasmid mobilization relaxosome protein MobC [Helicobacter suis]